MSSKIIWWPWHHKHTNFQLVLDSQVDMKDYNQAGSLWVRLLKAKYMSERNFFKSKKYMDLGFEKKIKHLFK
jgi:hypothetical protein